MLTEGMSDQELIAYLTAKIERLKEELDTERMRLAACGVIALSNTPDSAKQARQMKYEYWSASCADVADAVDRELALRDKLAECQAREAKLREALQEAVDGMGGSYAIWSITANEALALPNDDTALREYRRKVLLEAADWFEEKVYDTEDGHLHSEYHAADNLRNMAEEI